MNVITYSLFTDFDINLFKAGKHFRLYEKFGSHIITVNGIKGTYFAVWAPTANQVSVIGDFNFWEDGEHKLNVRWDSSGIWEGFIPMVGKGTSYKYKIHSNNQGYISEKATHMLVGVNIHQKQLQLFGMIIINGKIKVG